MQPADDFVWYPRLGYGVSLVPPIEYGECYWAKYEVMEDTKVGYRLLNLRHEFRQRHADPQWRNVDIGIGAGGFISYRGGGEGFDVNERAIEWLSVRDGLWTKQPRETLTFWDSFEHIPDPWELVALATEGVFVSMPIFESAEHCLSSKHYRPGEHLWYFTERGLIEQMRIHGMTLIERNRDEERFGREDIGSYYFARKP